MKNEKKAFMINKLILTPNNFGSCVHCPVVLLFTYEVYNNNNNNNIY